MVSCIASSNGASSEEELQHDMKQRKLQRMQSNGESARRSRQRKQKLLENLMAQVAKLKKENQHGPSRLSFTRQQCINIEAENSVLRAQMVELCNRLEPLNQIINCMHANMAIFGLLRPCNDIGLMMHRTMLMDYPDV